MCLAFPRPCPFSGKCSWRRVALTDLLCKSFDFCSSFKDCFLHSHRYFQTSLHCLRLLPTYTALLCATRKLTLLCNWLPLLHSYTGPVVKQTLSSPNTLFAIKHFISSLRNFLFFWLWKTNHFTLQKGRLPSAAAFLAPGISQSHCSRTQPSHTGAFTPATAAPIADRKSVV